MRCGAIQYSRVDTVWVGMSDMRSCRAVVVRKVGTGHGGFRSRDGVRERVVVVRCRSGVGR